MLTGLAYPLAIDPVTKGLAIASDADYIAQQIRSFVETERGERLGLPNYGLPDYLFSAYQAIGFIARDLETKLPQFIPQASFSCTASINDAGEAIVVINWIFQGENQVPLKFTFERG
jgi:hypothetical protein